MLQPHGTIVELVFVTRDLNRSIEHWIHDLHAGPFYKGFLSIPYVYQGLERNIDTNFAGGFSGGLLIELVQPDEQPSVFRDHLDKYGESLHHMQLRSSAFDFESEVARLKTRYKHIATGGIPGNNGAAEYFDCYENYGCQLKVLNMDREGLGIAQQAHENWDGKTRPVRSFAELVPGIPDARV
jgi:hypothetical protein